MSAPTQTLRQELELEFQAACTTRDRARGALLRKDSPANREAWREAIEEVNAVLDFYLDSKGECAD